MVVGNAGSLKEQGLGKQIDKFDMVIRFNRFKTKGYEEDAGSKTDVWCTFSCGTWRKKFILEYGLGQMEWFIDDYIKEGYNIEEIKPIVKDIKEIWYLTRPLEVLEGGWSNPQPLHNLNIYDTTIKRHRNWNDSEQCVADLGYQPSTGFNCLWTLLKMYDKIYVAGFDYGMFMGKSDTLHYYEDIERDKIPYHSRQKEYDYLKEYFDNGTIEFLTKDTKIQKAKYIGIKQNIYTCEICNKISNHYIWEIPICNWCER